MNTTTTISDIEHVLDCGTKPGCDHDGTRYWTRMIVCHGGGKTATLILHARKPEPLDFTPAQSIEAGLAEMDNDTLDSLANLIRAERQSRDAPLDIPQHAAGMDVVVTDDAVPAGVSLAEFLAPRYAEIDRHPRDCPGGPVTVTEDDGEPPF